MGLEGLVSKHRDRPYQAGRSKHWIKVKNRSLGIPTIATTHSDGPRPPVPNDRDQQ